MVHTLQTLMFTHFFTFQRWYTWWYTSGTQTLVTGTHTNLVHAEKTKLNKIELPTGDKDH